MTVYRALLVTKTDDGFEKNLVERSVDDLPDGDLLIEVRYSSVNYKDALSASGNPGVSRNFPHQPGIDAAGVVLESATGDFSPGDEVLVIGYDLGMNTAGGFGQRIRVPAGWAVKRPAGLSDREAMILGTAGFTAGLCVQKLERAGLTPGDGEVLVTGATGGVGSVATALLAKLGHSVVAVSGKPEKASFLEALGASSILSREEAGEGGKRPMLKERWAGVVDTVGGEILSSAIKSLRYGASAAICGMVQSADLDTSVFPFILRDVSLLGVDSVELPIETKAAMWNRLATDWKLDDLESLATEIDLDGLPAALDAILEGKLAGRTLVSVS